MAEERPKVIDLAEWRLKRLRLQSQTGCIQLYFPDLAGPGACGEAEARHLAEIRREIGLQLMRRRHERPEGKEG
jgi:hypothetical protein